MMASGNRPQVRVHKGGLVEVWRDGEWQEAHVTFTDEKVQERIELYGEYDELFVDLYRPQRRPR